MCVCCPGGMLSTEFRGSDGPDGLASASLTVLAGDTETVESVV